MKHASLGRLLLWCFGLGLLWFGSLLVALSAGPSELGIAESLAALFQSDAGMAHDIVVEIRLPRALLASLVGASLATAGVLFQALLRNPLADPFILGISGGAALGGVGVLTLGSLVGLGREALTPAAFAGALFSTLLLYLVAGVRGRVKATALLLTGVVFNAISSAAIIFLASLANMTEGASIFLWLIGHLGLESGATLAWIAALFCIGWLTSWLLARGLNVLTLGDEAAMQLGIPVIHYKRILLLTTSLMVGAAVSVSGLIGFVGLIVPHFFRLLVGADHRLLLPVAALGGASFLLLADTFARSLLPGREVPVGAVTALIGGPLFLWLLRRHTQRGSNSWVS